MKTKRKLFDNAAFVREKFEYLVDHFGGQTIVIANGEIFTGDDAANNARRKYSKIIPMIFSVPRPEFFSHHFLL